LLLGFYLGVTKKLIRLRFEKDRIIADPVSLQNSFEVLPDRIMPPNIFVAAARI
jgi:hypothetical protein